jgi:hypothetical protein
MRLRLLGIFVVLIMSMGFVAGSAQPTPLPKECGDTLCNYYLGENCENCPADCDCVRRHGWYYSWVCNPSDPNATEIGCVLTDECERAQWDEFNAYLDMLVGDASAHRDYVDARRRIAEFCEAVCGDGICSTGENCENCPSDCECIEKETICYDSFDDDGDGLTDCEDPDCAEACIQISIQPEKASLVADGKATVEIVVKVKDAEGKPLPGEKVRFKIEDPWKQLVDDGKLSVVEGVTDSQGQVKTVYTAPLVTDPEFKGAEIELLAMHKIRGAKAYLKIVTPKVERIIVTPNEVTLNPGEIQQFKAIGYDAEGNEIPIEPELWRLQKDRFDPTKSEIGTLNQDGLFKAEKIGKATIYVSFKGIENKDAVVTVSCYPDIPGNVEEIKRLYKERIPEGPIHVALKRGAVPIGLRIPGIINNIFALFTLPPTREFFQDWACGGYQGKVLDFLDALKSDPETCTLLNGFKYGPIQAYKGGHQAVVIYPINTDWRKTGTVLDPWPNQKPEIFTAPEWNKKFWWTMEPSWTWEDHPWVQEQSKLAEIKIPKSIPPAITPAYGVYVRSPVDVLITDSKGQRIGRLPDGSLVFEVPAISFYNYEKDDGTQGWFFELPADKYQVDITGTGTGTFQLIVGKEGVIQNYGNQPITAKAKARITLDPEIVTSPLILPDKREILPKIETIDFSDNDNDKVPDLVDKCLDTPAGALVDSWGCVREPTPTPMETPTPEVTPTETPALCGKEYQEYIATYNRLTDLYSEGKGDDPVAMKAYLDYTEAKRRYERCIECEESGGTWYGGECQREKAPGFEAVFAIVGLIMSYMLRKRK